MTALMTAMVDYLHHCQQYLRLHLQRLYCLPHQFSMLLFCLMCLNLNQKLLLQNEPTAKQQQQEHFSQIEAILKPEEEKPIMSNKLQSSFPDTDKIFQKMPAEIESKNETPISNLQTIAAELEIPRFYNSLVVVKMPNFEKNLKCVGWGRKWKNLLFH